MIRDPSDGTVREERAAEMPSGAHGKPAIDPGTSGLSRLKSDEIARLKASREWVKNWHQRKI